MWGFFVCDKASVIVFVFFFQAEDGIRDFHVTGVQTCALPISLIGFAVSIAHKADMGGLVPGSSGAGSREVFHDGLRLPPVRYQSAAGIDRDIEEVLRANSRTRGVVSGDTRGQVGATRLGAERLRALAEEYGRACVQ